MFLILMCFIIPLIITIFTRVILIIFFIVIIINSNSTSAGGEGTGEGQLCNTLLLLK